MFLLVEFWFDSSVSPCTARPLNELETQQGVFSDPKMSASKEPVAASAGFSLLVMFFCLRNLLKKYTSQHSRRWLFATQLKNVPQV